MVSRIAVLMAVSIAGCGSGDGVRSRGALELAPAELLGVDEPPEALSQAAIDALVATKVEQIGSYAVAERVVRELALNEDRAFMGVPEGEPSSASVEEAAERVREHVTVERREGSLVIDVTVSDADPRRAQIVCNALLQAAVEAGFEERILPQQLAQQRMYASLDRLREDRRSAEGDEAVQLDATIERVERELRDLELSARTAVSPLRVLDRCRMPAAR